MVAIVRSAPELRADIMGHLCGVERVDDLELVDRVVRVLLGAGEVERRALGLSRTQALRAAVTPIETLIDRSSVGEALRAAALQSLAPASTVPIKDLTSEIEGGRRCPRCLDPIVGDACGCTDCPPLLEVTP
jgi:hypothetical protein